MAGRKTLGDKIVELEADRDEANDAALALSVKLTAADVKIAALETRLAVIAGIAKGD